MATKKKTTVRRKRTASGPKPLPAGKLADIRARWSSAGYRDAESLAAHYQGDVGLLLDELDRLRYNVANGA